MRILLQTYAFRPSWGGVQKFVQSLYDSLSTLGQKVRIATSNYIIISEQEKYIAWPWSAQKRDSLCRFGFSAWSLARAYPQRNVRTFFYSVYLQLAYLRYWLFLCLFRPEILHLIYINVDAAFAIRAKKRFHFKLITSCRGSDILTFEKQNRSKQNLVSETLKSSDAITAVSNEISCSIRELLNNSRIPIHLIPNGIRCKAEDFDIHKKDVSRNFVFAGHLDDNKNPLFLVRTFTQFYENYPEFRLVIIGTGPLFHPLQKLVLESRVSDVIDLPGSLTQEETSVHIRNATAMILPSFREGCPNVVLEAMATGTPVIASNRSGIKEIIRHNENGLLFEYNNARQLLDCMARIVESTELRTRLIQNALRTIRERHDFNDIVRKYLILYQELLRAEQ